MMQGMGAMMGFGWVGAALVLALAIAGVLALTMEPRPSGGNIVLTVLAVIGGIVLVGLVAMVTMHAGMM